MRMQHSSANIQVYVNSTHAAESAMIVIVKAWSVPHICLQTSSHVLVRVRDYGNDMEQLRALQSWRVTGFI